MLTRITCPPQELLRLRGLAGAVIRPWEKAGGFEVVSAVPMPGAEVTVLIEVDRHDGAARELVLVLAALGLHAVVESPDAGADLAEARARITALIKGDGPAELRRWEKAKARFDQRCKRADCAPTG